MADKIFGEISPPPAITEGYGTLFPEGNKLGLVGFLNNVLKLVALAAGLFAVVNFILAGYGIMSSQGDPERMGKATSKIWNSLIGLILIVASFAFAALIGWIIFKNPRAILDPKIYGPN